MTRSQRIALAMRGYGPETIVLVTIDGKRLEAPTPLDMIRLLAESVKPTVSTKPPHTWSVYVRGPKGLLCS